MCLCLCVLRRPVSVSFSVSFSVSLSMSVSVVLLPPSPLVVNTLFFSREAARAQHPSLCRVKIASLPAAGAVMARPRAVVCVSERE